MLLQVFLISVLCSYLSVQCVTCVGDGATEFGTDNFDENLVDRDSSSSSLALEPAGTPTIALNPVPDQNPRDFVPPPADSVQTNPVFSVNPPRGNLAGSNPAPSPEITPPTNSASVSLIPNSNSGNVTTANAAVKGNTTTTAGIRTCEYNQDGESINITGSQFLRLDKQSFKSSKVKCLHLQKNEMEDIADGFFDELPNLRFADFSDNLFYPKILSYRSEIANLETFILDRAFNCRYHCRVISFLVNTSFPHLTTLYMRGNGIPGFDFEESYSNSLRKLMPRLAYLDLTDNHIKSVEFLKSVPATLTHLVLSGNLIDRFVGISLTHVEELFLDRNPLERVCAEKSCRFDGAVELKDAGHLRILSLARTGLEHINDKAFRDLKNLVELNLSHNNITQVRVHNLNYLTKLEILDLQDNRLSVVPDVCRLRNLVKLDLSVNPIYWIRDKFGCELPRLEVLSLRNIGIKYLPVGEFDNMPLLRNLDLSSNDLHAIPRDWIAPENNLQVLNLRWNMFESIANMSLTECRNLTKVLVFPNPLRFIDVASIKHLPDDTIALDLVESGRMNISMTCNDETIALEYGHLKLRNAK